MGTPDFALPTFHALLGSEEVIAIVTQPDRPKGRKGMLSPPPVKTAAIKNGIPVFQPERLRKAPDVVETLTRLAPDLIVVIAFGQILPENVLKIPGYGCINVHASLLPKYRGAGPIQWAIIHGEKETGITTMKMDAGMDTGPMLLKKTIQIDPDETAEMLSPRLAGVGAALLLETLAQLKTGKLKPIPQNDAEATLAPRIKKKEGFVQWEDSATVIYNRWRGLFPWPGLTTFHQKIRLKISSLTPGSAQGRFGKPGEILRLSGSGLEVAAGEGYILVKNLQPEGKRVMTPAEFAAGHRIEIGAFLEQSKG